MFAARLKGAIGYRNHYPLTTATLGGGDMQDDNLVVRRVVCAACRSTSGGEEVIVAGARHFDSVMVSQVKFFDDYIESQIEPWEQGFIDQFGVFMDRREAMAVAKASGQEINFKRNGSDPTELYSEGLY